MEGSMMTAFKVIWNTGYRNKQNNKKQHAWDTAGMILAPFLMHKRALNLGYSENQYRNMRRTWADYAFMAALYILASCVFCKPKRRPGEKDEEYKRRISRAKGLGYYITRRLCAEQAAFNSPIDAKFEAGQLLNIIPAGLSGLYDIGELTVLGVSAFFEPNYTKEQRKQLGIRGKTKKEKFANKAQTITPYYKSEKVTSDPYKATDSYMFQRKTKG